MKTCSITFAALLTMVLMLPFRVFAQAEQTNGPFSSHFISKMWGDESIVLVSTGINGPVFCSFDDCNSWEKGGYVNPAHAPLNFHCKFENKYWATSNSGEVIYTSIDGKQWTEFTDPWPADVQVGAKFIFVYANKLILINWHYILEYEAGWTKFQKRTDFWDFTNAEIRNAWYVADKFLVLTNKLWVSSDAMSWTDYSEGVGGQNIKEIIQVPGTSKLLAITSNGDIFSRDSNDVAWQSKTLIFNGKPLNRIIAGQKDSTVHLYVHVVANGLWHSSDKGENWEQLLNLPNESNFLENVLLISNNTDFYLLFESAKGIIHKSENAGQSWVESSQGYYNSITNICGVGNKDSIILSNGVSRLFRTTNQGDSWEIIPFFEEYSKYLPLSIKEYLSIKEGIEQKEVVYAATHGRGIVKSYDKGLSWYAYNSNYGDPQTFVNCMASKKRPDGSQYLLAGTVELGIMRSYNDGLTWSVLQNQLWYDKVTDLETSSGDAIFALIDGETVYRSKDEGQNWVMTNAGLENTKISSLYQFDYESNNTYVFASTSNGVFRSSDEGQSWDLVLPDTLDVDFLYLASYENNLNSRGDTLFAVRPSNIYWSDDGGDNWAILNIGLPEHRYLRTCAVIGDYLYMGLWFDGIWKYKIGSNTSAVPVAATQGEDCLRSKTLPGGNALLEFSLDVTSPVRLCIFDTQGRQLSTLVNTTLSPGTYSYTWPGASGQVYICTLETAFCRQSKKVFGAND